MAKKDTFINEFFGSSDVNIAVGDGAIGKQVNTIVSQVCTSGNTTVVSQQIHGHGNSCSGRGSVVINNDKIIINDEAVNNDNITVFIHKDDNVKGKSSECITALNNLVTEVRNVLGDKSDAFVKSVKQFLNNPESKARLAVIDEEVADLRLYRYPNILDSLSKLIMLSKENAPIHPKLKKAHDALVEVLASEMKAQNPDFHLMEIIKSSIKILTGED